MNTVKEYQKFEAKFPYDSDLNKVIFCEDENKYKAKPEVEDYGILKGIVGRLNSHWQLWQDAKADTVPDTHILTDTEQDVRLNFDILQVSAFQATNYNEPTDSYQNLTVFLSNGQVIENKNIHISSETYNQLEKNFNKMFENPILYMKRQEALGRCKRLEALGRCKKTLPLLNESSQWQDFSNRYKNDYSKFCTEVFQVEESLIPKLQFDDNRISYVEKLTMYQRAIMLMWYFLTHENSVSFSMVLGSDQWANTHVIECLNKLVYQLISTHGWLAKFIQSTKSGLSIKGLDEIWYINFKMVRNEISANNFLGISEKNLFLLVDNPGPYICEMNLLLSSLTQPENIALVVSKKLKVSK